jgi:hypothetical protein
VLQGFARAPWPEPIVATSHAQQSTFSTVVGFGDSYADSGNLFGIIGPSPLYPTGRFRGGSIPDDWHRVHGRVAGGFQANVYANGSVTATAPGECGGGAATTSSARVA